MIGIQSLGKEVSIVNAIEKSCISGIYVKKRIRY